MKKKSKAIISIVLLAILALLIVPSYTKDNYTPESYVAGDALFNDLENIIYTLTHIKERNLDITFEEYVQLKSNTEKSIQALDYFRQSLDSSHTSAPITLDINNSLIKLSSCLDALNHDFKENTSDVILFPESLNTLSMVRHELSVYKTRLDDIYP